jgi:hypothetical protein
MSANKTLVETTMSNATQIVNFALNGKLLANTSDNGRVLMAKVNNNSNGAALSLPIILVLIFILASIVGVIVTALFVMRSRFSTWRLDGSKSSPNDLEEAKPVETVDTKTPETKIDIIIEAPVEQDNKEQASPASNSPLINKEVAKEEEKVQEATITVVDTEVVSAKEAAPKEVVTSSSSLIVNVLNELSESVATKLESISDQEKEPLKDKE